MNFLTRFARFFGASNGGLGDYAGQQITVPSAPIIENMRSNEPDAAMQLSAVWACVSLIADTIAGLPIIVYRMTDDGDKEEARDSLLWDTLHDRPNALMTSYEFKRALALSYLLRGNAYGIIERLNGEAVSIIPVSPDQVKVLVDPDGNVGYLYTNRDNQTIDIPVENMLHIKGLGNGYTGMSPIDYMRATIEESRYEQETATSLYENGSKPTGILMIDKKLDKEKREAIRQNFFELTNGKRQRMFLLEMGMQFQSLTLTPADTQLLETRKFNTDEIARWFRVPSVLIGSSSATAWGSGISELKQGFADFTIGPMADNFAQAFERCVLGDDLRNKFQIELRLNSLLRASPKERGENYAQALQNGWMTRNEVRHLENLPSVEGGDVLTAQTNLAPLGQLGQTTSGSAPSTEPIKQ